MPRKIKKQPPANEPEFVSRPVEDLSPVKSKPYRADIKLDYAVNSRLLKKKLAGIYAEAEEEQDLIELRRGRKKIRVLTALVIVLAFLAGVSWLGFFLFDTGKKFSEDDIKLTIDSQAKAQAGNTITYRIYYGNLGKIPLGQANLSVNYPDGFKFQNANPAPRGEDKREWDLGALEQNKDGLVEITGQMLGSTGSDLTLRAFLDYHPADFNSDFQKIVNFTTRLEDQPIEWSLKGPEELTTGEEGEYTLQINNSADKALNNLELSMELPAGFKLNSVMPPPTKDQNVWPITALDPQASTTLKFKGIFTGETEAGNQTMKIKLALRDGATTYSQQTLEKTIVVTKAALQLAVVANGTSDKQSINFGDKVAISLAYENTGQVKLKNVTLRLVLDTPSVDKKSLFDWTTIEDKHDGTIKGEQLSDIIRRGMIIWNKAQIPALAEIKPGDKGTIDLILSVKNKDTFDPARMKEFKTAIYGEALTGQASDNQPASIQSNNLQLILNSDLNLSMQATFRETKNLPVRVGQTYDTKSLYTIAWTITNTMHEVTDLILTTTLPENVDWGNVTSVSAGEISFDDTVKQVVWKLNRLPTLAAKATISFDVGVKAKDVDKGKEALITEKIRVEAKDKVTGENILFWRDPIATML